MLRILGLFPLLCCLAVTAFAEVRIIELKYRPAAELVDKVREILDDEEKVTDAGNHLLLVAEGESLAAAEQLIALLDRKLTPLVIRLRQAEARQILAQEASGSQTYSNRNQLSAAVSSGRQLGNSTTRTEQMLRVLEGEGGWLEVGQDVPYTEEWAVLAGDTAGYSERINYKTIAVGFWVRPVKIVQDGVLVDIEPRFSRRLGQLTDPPEIRFSQSRTRLQVPLSQWQPLSSYIQRTDRAGQAILRWRSDAGVSDEELFIRIDPGEGFSP